MGVEGHGTFERDAYFYGYIHYARQNGMDTKCLIIATKEAKKNCIKYSSCSCILSRAEHQ